MYNRILCSQFFPEIDKHVLGQGLHSTNDLIREISKNEPHSTWVENVNSFISNLDGEN